MCSTAIYARIDKGCDYTEPKLILHWSTYLWSLNLIYIKK